MEQLDLFGNRIDKTIEALKLLEKRVGPISKEDGANDTEDTPAEDNYEMKPLNTDVKPNGANKIIFTAEEKRAILSRPGIIKSINPIVFEDDNVVVRIKSKPAGDAMSKEDKKAAAALQKRGRKSFKDMDAEVDLIEIPDDEVLFQKQYYSISTVAEWFNVNTSLIRFWENEFDVLKPKKNRKGDRLFRPEDVKNLHLIYHLLRQRKYTIDGAKEYMKTHKNKADLQFKLTNNLEKIKSFLIDIKSNL